VAVAESASGSQGTILIGFADALAAPEAAWSVLAADWRVVAFSRTGSKPALRLDRRVELAVVTAPEVDAARCSSDVARVAAAVNARVVLPMDDAALLVCGGLAEGIWSSGNGPVVAGPAGSQLRFVLDKREQLEAAAQAGLAVPRLTTETEADFPVIVKPALAGRLHDNRLIRGGSTVCIDAATLRESLAHIREPVIVQPCLSGVGEGLFCIVTAAGPRAWSAHRRVRMMNPSGSGASACTPIPVDRGLAAAAGRMLMTVGWRGIAMVELLRDDQGAAWFMEVNGRTWGSTALARRLGLEYPSWAVSEAIGEAWTDEGRGATVGSEGMLVRHAGRELVHLLAVLRGPQSPTPQPWPARAATLRSVLRLRQSDKWYNSQHGLRLFLDDTYRTVAGQIRSHLT
jgi:biotin carboxylase